MKKAVNYTIIISCLMILITLGSCSKYDSNTELRGKTFSYSNGERGQYRIYRSYYFAKSGKVTHKSEVGSNHLEFEDWRYILENGDLTIYYGKNGEVAETGTYHETYLMIDGKKYEEE